MRYRKTTLFTIIVLLIFFLPITIFSTFKAIQNSLYVENPTHQFNFENKLYFYNEDKLIGRYYCQNKICALATQIINKDESIILKEYEAPINLEIDPINNKFAFIKDTNLSDIADTEYILYNIEEEKEIARYKEVKNYNIGLDNNLFIIKNANNKYGVISLKNGVQLCIKLEYDYIGASPTINPETSKIESANFAVKKDESWQIISESGSVSSSAFTDAIYNYNSTYIILKNENDEFYITNYNGDKIFDNTYQYLDFYNRFLVLIDNLNYFSVYDLNSSVETEKYLVKSIEDVTLTTEGNKVIVSIGGGIVETLAIK